MKPKYFNIPEPCSADWNSMTTTEQGAFCSQCNKEVIDLFQTPATEIKTEIARRNNPCVRILQSQIDEMNFMEWFSSKSLKKQLRVAFFFTFLFVFQFKGHAQDTLEQPNRIEELNDTRDSNIENEEILEAELITTELDSISSTTPVDSVIFWIGPDVTPPWMLEDIGWMGVPPTEPPIFPWTDIDLFKFEIAEDVAVIGGSVLYHDPSQYRNNPLKNQIILNENIYAFDIIADELHFTYKTLKHQKLRIKITNENGDVVYFSPIEVGRGENTISYSLEKFEMGHYIITLETAEEKQSTKIVYL
jgi:hypothetical protein